jgi:hypothetical protein
MKTFLKAAVAGVVLAGAAMFASAPAQAGVHIGIGLPGVRVGVGGPAYYYGPGYYPPGPCDAYTSYYEGDCGYSSYDGPIYLDGAYVTGPHYYRWYNGAPLFWYRGGWHNWDGWRGARFGWNHGEGWGWRGGRWDRGWGRDGGIGIHIGGGWRGDHGGHDHGGHDHGDHGGGDHHHHH